MTTTGAHRNHRASTLARAGVAMLLALLLPFALAAQEAPQQQEQAQQQETPAQDAASQSAPPQEAPPPADAPQDAAIETEPQQAATPPRVRERGVLFKVTPPAAALLPAETQQAEAAPAVDAPATPAAPPSPEPPRASYLLGTIHFGTPEEQGIDHATLEALAAEVETFVNEADLKSEWKPEYDGYRWLPLESPLGAMLQPGDMDKAAALLPAVKPQDMERMKPWAVLALLEARGEGDAEATLDARLQRMAVAAGKRTVHLETLEQQLQALDCVPASEHALVLHERLQK
ncbi:MAG: TraB/GumN family protein, partial [Thermomonas sp.]|uniref:TraB/GumN family protein n=1 Tax=Thermomonas sp. TaxID=1971895 RepID=UPI0039E60B33